MKINKLFICYPGGNINAVVADLIPKSERTVVAEKLLNTYNLNKSIDRQIEQVLFLERPHNPKAMIRLCLTGEEFSGNASLCAARLVLLDKSSGFIEISGSKRPLLAKNFGKEYISCEIPFSNTPSLQYSSEKYPLISMEGINHIVVIIEKLTSSLILRKRAKLIIENNRLNQKLAVGVLFVLKSGAKILLFPYIYFKKGERYELVAETACGSGSVAVAIYELFNSPMINYLTVPIMQPSGYKLNVNLKKKINQINCTLKGKVKILYEGTYYL